MIDPGFEILNQRGTPMFFSDVFANRPTAGVVGRIFISTDTYAFYRDTGTTWDLIGGPGTGTITGSISAGQVAYGTAANTIGGSNNLYFDSASNRLGIGTTSPTATLSVVGTGQFSGNVTIVNNANVLTRLNVQNDTIGALSRAGIYLSSDILSGNATFGKNSSGGTSYFTTSPTDTYIENSGYGDITIQNAVSGGRIKFSGGGASTSQMTLFSTGNLGIGVGLTDGGQRLQVTGNVNFGGASGFTWDNTNARLGIGTNAPAVALDVRNGANLYTSGASANSHYLELVSTSSTDGYVNFRRSGGANGPASYYISGGTARFTYNAATGDTILGVYAASPLLFFTNSTERMRLDASGNLGLGTATPTRTLTISGTMNVSTTNGTQPFLLLDTTTNYKGFSVDYSSSFITQINFGLLGRFQYDGNDANMIFANRSTSALANFRFVIDTTDRMRLLSTGNLIIQNGGTFTDSGQRLQVTGDGYFSGSVGIGTTSLSNTNLSITKNLTGLANVYGIFNSGSIRSDVTTGAQMFTSAPSIQNAVFTLAGLKHFEAVGISSVGSATITSQFGFYVESLLTGATNNYGFFGNIASGTGRWNLYMNGTAANYLNGSLSIGTTTQSGKLYVSLPGINTTFDSGSAADARIEFRRAGTRIGFLGWDSGYVALQADSGNYLGFNAGGTERARIDASGNLLLGSSTAFTANERLQVTGTQQNKHAVTYSTGSIQSFRIQKDLTIGSGATISTASTLSNGIFTGDNVFGGSVSVPASSPFANIYAANYYQFSAAGVTVTQDQAAGGSRALSQYYAQNYFKGTNSGTITHMASMQIAGYYNNNTGSITPVITNAYQLLINDINEYAHTFTLTNRWGIYQEGASDRNYMAGKLMLNTTTDTGQRIQINGDIRIDGQLSGTAGGNSGQHLIVNCDGTLYKIALLNN